MKKYSSIDNLRKSSEVLSHELVVTEKLHGTNVRFFWNIAGLYVGGRNTIIFEPTTKEPKNDSYKFYDYLKNLLRTKDLIKKLDNYAFYGEYHGPGIQKGIVYGKEKDLRIFDIRHPDGHFLDWDEVLDICNKMGFRTVPEFFRGTIKRAEELNKFLDINSKCAIENGVELESNIAEGVVLKPLKETRDKRGNRIISKYKSKKWAENNEGAREPKELTQEQMDLQKATRDFAEMVVTLGRVSTIVEHITRDGNTEVSMKRTGEFLKEFMKDVLEEYSDVYKELDAVEKKVYSKTVTLKASRAWKEYVENC